jgi:putative transposase
MARPLRPEHPGAVWHVWNRGVNRADIFFSDDDRILFIALLAKCVRRFRWVVHQFTLMTNHFHIALETPEPTLSRGMKWLEGTYVRRINRRFDRIGPLFQGRFKGQLVEKESYLLELMRYIALNPVARRWSSEPSTTHGAATAGWPDSSRRPTGSTRDGLLRSSVTT